MFGQLPGSSKKSCGSWKLWLQPGGVRIALSLNGHRTAKQLQGRGGAGRGGREAGRRAERRTADWLVSEEEVAHYNDTNEARCPDQLSMLASSKRGPGAGTEGKDGGFPRLLRE